MIIPNKNGHIAFFNYCRKQNSIFFISICTQKWNFRCLNQPACFVLTSVIDIVLKLFQVPTD